MVPNFLPPIAMLCMKYRGQPSVPSLASLPDVSGPLSASLSACSPVHQEAAGGLTCPSHLPYPPPAPAPPPRTELSFRPSPLSTILAPYPPASATLCCRNADIPYLGLGPGHCLAALCPGHSPAFSACPAQDPPPSLCPRPFWMPLDDLGSIPHGSRAAPCCPERPSLCTVYTGAQPEPEPTQKHLLNEGRRSCPSTLFHPSLSGICGPWAPRSGRLSRCLSHAAPYW